MEHKPALASKVRISLGVAALVAALAAPVAPLPGLAAAQAVDTTSPIKHVVIIYQENHTFDDVLGAACQQRVPRCNGFTGPVTLADGKAAPNGIEPDIVPNVAHGPRSQDFALANMWDRIPGCTTAPYACVTHVAPSSIPNLVAFANKFTVSDATFAAGDAASFGAHVEIAAGTEDGFHGDNPVPSKTGVAAKTGWGCSSNKDALWGSALSYQPSCIPLADGSGAYRPTQVPYVPTIMQALESASLSWRLYMGDSTKAPSTGGWNFCTYFTWCVQNRYNTTYNTSYGAFTTAASNGSLPTVSFLPASGPTSQHNNTSMSTGDNYIGDMVKAIESGPQWSSTAIFITWDDCGCFYDHVKPPSGLGLRNPMVIISPYAKPAFTDSTTAVQPYSMLSFIDHSFGLPALTPAVANAYDYSNAFDFSQTPLSPIATTHTPIPARTQAEVASLEYVWGSDPT
jgi:phospholipase C